MSATRFEIRQFQSPPGSWLVILDVLVCKPSSAAKTRGYMARKTVMAIILAAGKGKRMGSDLPKVLVPVCGRPMIRYVIDAVRAAGVERILIVVGYMASLVRNELADRPGLEFIVQSEQLGTGHAVKMCEERLELHEG